MHVVAIPKMIPSLTQLRVMTVGDKKNAAHARTLCITLNTDGDDGACIGGALTPGNHEMMSSLRQEQYACLPCGLLITMSSWIDWLLRYV
jgi:hypothetical protein